MEDIVVTIDGKEHNVIIEEEEDGTIVVHHNGETYKVETKSDIEPVIEQKSRQNNTEHEKGFITAPLPGTVSEVKVKKEQDVKEGQALVKLIAMKMENEIVSPVGGKVKEIMVKEKQNVNKGDILVVIE